MKNNENLLKSVSLKPFKYLTPSVRTEAYCILALLLPHVLMLLLTKSFASIAIIISSLLASLFVDITDHAANRKDAFMITVSIIRGLAIGLMIPSAFSPFTVFFITLSVLLLNRYVLGGFANSWVNPVAVTVAICWIIGMQFFPQLSISLSDLQVRNPALTLIQNGSIPVLSVDPKITGFLNEKLFSMFGVAIPDGYISFLWDTHSIIPAFRFNLLTLVSSIYLFAFNLLSPIIPCVFLITYGGLVRLVAPFLYNGPLFNGDVILAFLSSGVLFSTIFLLQWHGTTPLTNRGKFFYGLFAGILAFLIIGVGMSSSGYVFTILIINVISPLIQSIENHYLKKDISTSLVEKAISVSEGEHA
ncbi:RnfABCDGE type electron transport complex subunit D [Treponema zioleckii]|uniref:RnfABCDGE type electron transport complex subunit D n=1 Tax=Treponema zioleckii TaxID=331680 RepID=UPI00168BD52D|nr:RnfABCDGE type electron transport complex subunit D [Treponema zioleckii]